MVPVMNYAVSFGDNYCVGANNAPGYLTETPDDALAYPPPEFRESAGPASRARMPTSTHNLRGLRYRRRPSRDVRRQR